MPIRIGITGGIGSGKSEVCRILQNSYGCGLYNADQSVKSLYDRHPNLLSEVESLVGESLRDDEGRFVPSRLASRIFADRETILSVSSPFAERKIIGTLLFSLIFSVAVIPSTTGIIISITTQ